MKARAHEFTVMNRMTLTRWMHSSCALQHLIINIHSHSWQVKAGPWNTYEDEDLSHTRASVVAHKIGVLEFAQIKENSGGKMRGVEGDEC